MTQDQAIDVAVKAKPDFELSNEFEYLWAQKRVVPIVEGAPVRDELPKPGKIQDFVAWVVCLGDGLTSAEITVDDKTAAVLRIRKSR